jgi:hypothetical protein
MYSGGLDNMSYKMTAAHRENLRKALIGRKGLCGKDNPNYKDGHYVDNRCVDCCRSISPQATRCKKCDSDFYSGKNGRNYKHGETGKDKKHYCKCGHKIAYYSWRYRSGKCRSCAQIGHIVSEETRTKKSLRYQGRGNPNYKGGGSLEIYPSVWTKELKELIRQRDNHKCQNCGTTEEQLIGYHKKLDVHHIDYNKKNSNPSNLISLCKKCHMKSNHRRDFYSRFYTLKMGAKI